MSNHFIKASSISVINPSNTDVKTIMSPATETYTYTTPEETEEEEEQNVLNFTTDINSSFKNKCNNEQRSLSASNAYGNINKLNCRTYYMESSEVSCDDYVSTAFENLNGLMAATNTHLKDTGEYVLWEQVYNDPPTQLYDITDSVARINNNNLNCTQSITFNHASTPASLTNVDGVLTTSGDLTITGTCLAGGYYNTSDRRLKTNIKPLSNDVTNIVIDNFKPVEFKYITSQSNSDKTHYGLIAQDIQPYLPDLVDSNGSYLSVNYIELIPILLSKIQQLEKRVSELENNN